MLERLQPPKPLYPCWVASSWPLLTESGGETIGESMAKRCPGVSMPRVAPISSESDKANLGSADEFRLQFANVPARPWI